MTMLRDINRFVDGKLDSTDARVGVLASEIPNGFASPAFLRNDIDAAFPNRLYSLEILTLPTAGTLYLNKAGVGSFLGAPVGTYTGTQRVRKYDPGVGLVSDAPATYSLQVNAIIPPAPTVTSVTVNPEEAVIPEGSTLQFSAVASGANGPPQTFTWSTDKGQVSGTGVVSGTVATTAQQIGTVTATSTFNGVKGTATFIVPALVVVQPPVDPPTDPANAPPIFASTIMSDDGIFLSTVLL